MKPTLRACLRHYKVSSGSIYWVAVSSDFFDTLGKGDGTLLIFQKCDSCQREERHEVEPQRE